METGCEAPRIVAGMPMYNEEETIGTVVTMALRHVDEVICIDDGSSDSSARIAEACGATVIRHRGPFLARAMQTGRPFWSMWFLSK